jgi:hypothetical protein
MSEEEFAPNGVISEIGLSRLWELMPESADKIKTGLRPVQILTFGNITVCQWWRGSGRSGINNSVSEIMFGQWIAVKDVTRRIGS